MSEPLPQPPSPDALATRHDFDTALARAGAPARFVGWSFPGADLSDLDLRGCEFSRCRGAGADFSRADAAEATFESCDFSNARFRHAGLSSTVFRDCKLTGAEIIGERTFGLTFARCLLVSANLHGLSFRGENLDGIDFQGADLTQADFRDAKLSACNLREANVTDARFQGADLRGADLGALRITDASRFKGAIISKQQAAALLGGLGLRVA